MTDSDGQIGGRRGQIAVERKLRGLTQKQLAEKARISLSLLRKVEQGTKPPSAGMVSAVARALGVEREKLTGQPYRTGNQRKDTVFDLVPAVRRQLFAYREPPGDAEEPARLDLLAADVAELSRLRHRSDLMALGRPLPAVLDDLRGAALAYEGADRERVMWLLAEAYYGARQWLRKLGFGDLASLLSDRYEWAAAQSGDPLTLGLAAVLHAGEMDGAGDWLTARALMSRTVDQFDHPLDKPQAASVYGWLHLNAAYVAAHAGAADDVWSHHREAARLAKLVGHGRDDYRLAFGPTNVGVWGVGLAVELMDGPEAMRRARDVRIPADFPAERAGHHYIDLARGCVYAGKRQAALATLQRARQVSPQQTRYHPAARETFHALTTEERRTSGTLREFAAWMGVD